MDTDAEFSGPTGEEGATLSWNIGNKPKREP